MRTKVYKISKERAIEIAMNHNCVSREIAEKYSNSELKEVLTQLNRMSRTIKMKGDF